MCRLLIILFLKKVTVFFVPTLAQRLCWKFLSDHTQSVYVKPVCFLYQSFCCVSSQRIKKITFLFIDIFCVINIEK